MKKKILNWLNQPVTTGIFSPKPVRRWHFWHPGSGWFGGLILSVPAVLLTIYIFERNIK